MLEALLVLLLMVNACQNNGGAPQETPPPFDRVAMLDNILKTVIRPEHAAFHQQAEALESTIEAFTAAPSAATLEAAQSQWAAAFLSWKRCELFNMGPAKEQFIHSQISSLPTQKTFITNFITGDEPIDEAFVASKGATSKGLPAIEWLLFDPSANNAAVVDSFTVSAYATPRKAYLNALCAFLHTSAERLSSIWMDDQGYSATFLKATDNANLEGSFSLLVNSLVGNVEGAFQKKLGKPMGKSLDNTPQPELLESPYGHQSLQAIRKNLEVAELLYLGNEGAGLEEYLVSMDAEAGGKLDAAIKSKFAVAYQALDGLSPSLYQAIHQQPNETEAAYDALRD